MKKTTALVAAILLCLIPLAGCDKPVLNNATASPAPSALPVETSAPAATATPTLDSTPTPTPEPTPEPTSPGILSPDVYNYFQSVGFGIEGEIPAVAKWTQPIRIQVSGAPNAGDRKVLSGIIGKLKGIPGMPEITLVTEGGNIVIGFVPAGEGKKIDAGYNGKDDAQGFIKMDGGVVKSVHIILTDSLQEQARRDSSLSFFLFNGLGLAADAQGELADSILNRSGTALAPSRMDWMMLRLLYGAPVAPEMSQVEAMPVIMAFDPGTDIYDAASANNPNTAKEDVLAYFNEVGFDWPASLHDGIISKWAAPIKLQITGSPSEEQQAMLDTYVAALNKIKGFPGCDVVESGGTMVIAFQSVAQLKKSYTKMTAAESCFITMNRGEKNGIIAKCTIGVATDFEDMTVGRNQFLRLLMKSLGFTFTSGEYPDSIFNYSSKVQEWSGMDWKMAGLLYRSDIKAGDKRAAVMKLLGSVLN